MKLPSLKGSALGSSTIEGLGNKAESVISRPDHQLERRITPHLLGGRLAPSHGSHIKAKSMAAGMSPVSMGTMPTIPGV